MTEGKKRLSLEISSTEAKTGAKEISQLLSGLSKQADDLTKQFQDLLKLQGQTNKPANKPKPNKPSSDNTKPLRDEKAAVDGLKKSYEGLVDVMDDELKVYHQANAVMKDAIKGEGRLAVAMANRSDEALKSYANTYKEVKLTQEARKGVEQRVDAELGLTKVKKEAMTATERLAKAEMDSAERADDYNKEVRNSIALNNAKINTENQLVRSAYQVTDEYRTQAEQIIKNRVDRQAYEREFEESYKREKGLITEVTAEQRVREEMSRKEARALEIVKAAEDGRLESMLRAQRESERAIKATRESVNAMSEEEKQAEALNAAMTKLENTRRAEAARTEALATTTGKESVRVQELRRVQEELARSTERLNLLRTEQGKRLVQQRVEAEMLTRAYREELLGSERLTHSFSNMTSAASALSTAMSGLIVYFSVAGLARTADAYTNLTNRLSSVTRGTVDVTQATRELLQVSIETRSSLESVMDIQSKMVRINENLGKSQQEVANLTEAVSKAVAMSGASIQGAQGAIMQFSQAMSANWKTSAQELNSILEQTPALAYYMVEGLREVTGEVGLTAGTLKKFAEEGGLSAEIVFEAFQKVLPRIREDFKETSQTIASAMENLKDSFTVTLGEMSKEGGITKAFTEGVVDLAKELPNLKTELEGLTLSLGTFVTLVTGSALAATVGLTGLAIGGLIASIAALVGVTYTFIASQEDASDTIEAQEKRLQVLTDGVDKYNAAISVANSTSLQDTINAQEEVTAKAFADLLDAQTRYAELQAQYESNRQSFWSTYVMPTTELSEGEMNEALTILNNALAIYNKEVDKYLSGQSKMAGAKSRDSEKALSDLQKQLVEVTGGYEGLTKIEKEYETVVKNINETYNQKITAIQKETDEATKLQRTNEAQLLLTAALSKAEKDRQEAIDEYNAKASRDSKRLEERLKRYAEETANIREQANALQLGGKALEEYNAKQQALKGLSSKDANNLLEEEVELYNKRVEAILKTNQAQQDANFERSVSDLQEEREALAKGTEAYQEYLVRKQAIQAIGGIVTKEDLDMVDELTAKMQKLANDQKSLTASTNLKSLQAELTARMEGEEAYQELLAHRAALQALGISEADLANIEGMKEKYKEVRDVLDDISYYADLQINPFSDLADSLERSSDVFGDFASNLSSTVSLIDNLRTTQEEYQKNLKKYAGDEDKISQIQSDNLRDQTSMYGDLLGSAKGFFKEGSKGYQALQAAQMTFRAFELAASIKATAQALVEGQAKATAGVANQANGDPYTAFARIAAMAAIMAGLGFAVGGGGGGSANIAADRQESQGTGTVLGDLSAKSESINNAVEYSADALEDLVGINSGMLSELRNLNNAMSGAANLIARDIDYSEMGMFTGLSADAKKLEGLFGSIGGSLGGGLFGKTKVVDQGVQILGGTLSEIIEETTVQAYQQTQKKSWFKSSTSIGYQSVSDAVENQFDLVFQSLFNTVQKAAVGLGYSQSEIQDRLDRFVVESFKISLKDLSPEDQVAELNAVFSSVFDQLATSVVPLMQEFQNAGEGMGEALARVSTNFQVVNEAISQLNLQALTGTTDNILRASEAFVGLFEDAGDLAGSFTGFVDTFATEERQLEILTSGLTRALGEQDVAILQSREGVYDYIRAVQESGVNEAERIANILKLTDSLDEYFDLLEDVNGSVENVSGNMNDLVNRFLGTVGLGGFNTLTSRIEEFNNASSDAERQLLMQIYAVEDYTEALSGLEQAYSSIQSEVDSVLDSLTSMVSKRVDDINDRRNVELDSLEESYNLQISSIEEAYENLVKVTEDDLDAKVEANELLIESLREAVNVFSSILSAAETASETLIGAIKGQEFVRELSYNVLSRFIATGDTSGVEGALGNVTQFDERMYSDAFSFAYAQADTLQLVKSVESLAGTQLSDAEMQLEATETLNDTLQNTTSLLLEQMANDNEALLEALSLQNEESIASVNSNYDSQVKYFEDMLTAYNEQIELSRGSSYNFANIDQATTALEQLMATEKGYKDSVDTASDILDDIKEANRIDMVNQRIRFLEERQGFSDEMTANLNYQASSLTAMSVQQTILSNMLQSIKEIPSGVNEGIDSLVSGMESSYLSDGASFLSVVSTQINSMLELAGKYSASYSEITDELKNLYNVAGSYVPPTNTAPEIPTESVQDETEGSTGSGNTPSPSISYAEIAAAVDSVYSKHTVGGVLNWDAAESEIFSLALANNISSIDLANATGIPQESILDAATRLGFPAFANGGSHDGGWRWVGDKFGINSPSAELEYTAPSQIFNRNQVSSLIEVDAIVGELRMLREEVSNLRAETRAVVKNTKDTFNATDEMLNATLYTG